MPSETKVQSYKTVLKKLLPRGRLWTVTPGGVLDLFLEGIAVELARIDERGSTLLDEGHPLSASELLSDWEEELGIPGNCETLAPTVDERRNVAYTKLTKLQDQSKQSFVDIAASLGYEIDVDDVIEYRPFRAGSRAGERLTNGPWVHTFSIRIPGLTVRTFTAGSRAGERLVEFGDQTLECLMTEHKPAHTTILFQVAE